MKAKNEAKTETKAESSSAFFQKLRPKFLDWKPPTEQEKALAVKARTEAKEAELKRVTELAREREVEKARISSKRYRSAAARNKLQKLG